MKSALDPQTETQPQSRRGRGEGRIWRIGRIWWIQYYVHGRQVRESSHSDRKPVAERLIRRRLGEAAAGIVTFPQSARVTWRASTVERSVPMPGDCCCERPTDGSDC